MGDAIGLHRADSPLKSSQHDRICRERDTDDTPTSASNSHAQDCHYGSASAKDKVMVQILEKERQQLSVFANEVIIKPGNERFNKSY